MTGKFISLEGGEGSGKSTAIATIKAWLESQKIDYIMTREPGGTELAEQIRQLILAARDEPVDDMTELLLMFAARAQHMTQTIRPALAQGIWVISDRFIDSSFVYQGKARGGDTEKLKVLTEWVVGNDKPDATLLLDVPVEIGLQRVAQRKDADRLDQESSCFHEKVRQGFLAQAALEPDRIKVIDASQSLDQVNEQIINQLNGLKSAW
ncbi:dTMP kinase [Marinomonas pollencensis]|uniref:Thymidylate kinase n=1 Tax=Marinomonas pollencensis TaxID=491954 RepID=A0A3E0DUD2_9GAMM|nr:dTMP kinase [Marinomonas pollencensis]REG85742.1 thymidylate kinase [Marinomonas pollencensis]